MFVNANVEKRLFNVCWKAIREGTELQKNQTRRRSFSLGIFGEGRQLQSWTNLIGVVADAFLTGWRGTWCAFYVGLNVLPTLRKCKVRFICMFALSQSSRTQPSLSLEQASTGHDTQHRDILTIIFPIKTFQKQLKVLKDSSKTIFSHILRKLCLAKWEEERENSKDCPSSYQDC